MAHKIGRKVFGNRPDFLGISNNPAPAPAPEPTESQQSGRGMFGMGGSAMQQPGKFNFGGTPSPIVLPPVGGTMQGGEQAQPMPVQQGQPCPDPSAHAPGNQMQSPGAIGLGQAAFNNRFPGIGQAIGNTMMPRPSMMPKRFFGGFRGLF